MSWRVPGTVHFLTKTKCGKRRMNVHTWYHSCTASSASLPLLAGVLALKIQQQQSLLSVYRSEEINHFLVPVRIRSYYYRRFRTQNTIQHSTFQTRTNRRQRLLQIKATAKSGSWVAHLLVLSAGDIIRGYCPKQKQRCS